MPDLTPAVRCPKCGAVPGFRVIADEQQTHKDDPAEKALFSYKCQGRGQSGGRGFPCGHIYVIRAGHLQRAKAA